MVITIASGKGGTGKTTIATSLFLVSLRFSFLDADAEGPNAHHFLQPKITSSLPVFKSLPSINHNLCNLCNRCVRACQFNALASTNKTILLFEELCHECGVCSLVCPRNAVTERRKKIGEIKLGKVGRKNFFQCVLYIGESSPVGIIREGKKKAEKEKNLIIDSSPGSACPTAEALKGSDFALLVTEPTPLSLHDLKLVYEVVREINIKSGVVINKTLGSSEEIFKFCKERSLPILLQIPFRREIAQVYSRGVPLAKVSQNWKEQFQALLKKIEREI